MKNAILPSVSSHQLYSFGSASEFISEVPAHMDKNPRKSYGTNSLGYTNIHSNLYDNDQYDFFIPPQLIPMAMDYQSGLMSTTIMTSRVDCNGAAVNDSLQTSFPFTKKQYLTVPRNLDENQGIFINPRKRPIIEVGHDKKEEEEEGSVLVTNNSNIIVANELWKNTTKLKVIHQEQQKSISQDKKQVAVDQIPRANKLHVRRSQKLSDKITALQKLVSPYGKTDTASVLEEAYISIKFLQDQIQIKLLNKLSSSCMNTKHLEYQKKTEEMQLDDLHSRGLCLIPVSHINDAKIEHIYNKSTSIQSTDHVQLGLGIYMQMRMQRTP